MRLNAQKGDNKTLMEADMRKIINILCAVMAIVLFCCGVAGCAPRSAGAFYTLEEAYEEGWLTQDDLKSIAELHNNNLQYSEKLDEEIARFVKETAAQEARDDEHSPFSNAKAEDFTILKYYGIYHQDCYVVMLDEPYFYFPAVEVDEWKDICGVSFHITSFYEIKVWKK